MKRWNVVSLPLERNTKDSRDESWKIQGSKTEWETLSDKIIVKRKLSRKEWVELITYLKENHNICQRRSIPTSCRSCMITVTSLDFIKIQ